MSCHSQNRADTIHSDIEKRLRRHRDVTHRLFTPTLLYELVRTFSGRGYDVVELVPQSNIGFKMPKHETFAYLILVSDGFPCKKCYISDMGYRFHPGKLIFVSNIKLKTRDVRHFDAALGRIVLSLQRWRVT